MKSRGWIVDRRQTCCRKITSQFGRRRNGTCHQGSGFQNFSLETKEKECFVFYYGSAEGPTKLILDQRHTSKTGFIGKVIIRIQNLIAQILVSGAVKSVGSRFGGEVNHPSRVVTILSGDVVGDDTELLHGILRGNERVEIAGRCVGGDTIDVEGALVPEASADRVVSKTNGVSPCAARLVRYRIAVGPALGHYAGDERQHVVHVSSA